MDNIIYVGPSPYGTAPYGGRVSSPSITATNMISPTICVQPCTITIDITWTNYGDAGTFIPAILVDGIRTELSLETLGPNSSVTHSFLITGLSLGNHLLCPDPN